MKKTAVEHFRIFGKATDFSKNVRSLILFKGKCGTCPFSGENRFLWGRTGAVCRKRLGIGSCWVRGTLTGKALCYPEDEHIQAVIALGHSGEEGIGRETDWQFIPYEEKPGMNAFRTRFLSSLDSGGMEAAALAPSALNKQKPKFLYEHGELRASVPDNYDMDMVDLGIAKYHFLKGVGGEELSPLEMVQSIKRREFLTFLIA